MPLDRVGAGREAQRRHGGGGVRPRPDTSPTTTSTVPSSLGITSYQSPPMSSTPGRRPVAVKPARALQGGESGGEQAALQRLRDVQLLVAPPHQALGQDGDGDRERRAGRPRDPGEPRHERAAELAVGRHHERHVVVTERDRLGVARTRGDGAPRSRSRRIGRVAQVQGVVEPGEGVVGAGRCGLPGGQPGLPVRDEADRADDERAVGIAKAVLPANPRGGTRPTTAMRSVPVERATMASTAARGPSARCGCLPATTDGCAAPTGHSERLHEHGGRRPTSGGRAGGTRPRRRRSPPPARRSTPAASGRGGWPSTAPRRPRGSAAQRRRDSLRAWAWRPPRPGRRSPDEAEHRDADRRPPGQRITRSWPAHDRPVVWFCRLAALHASRVLPRLRPCGRRDRLPPAMRP